MNGDKGVPPSLVSTSASRSVQEKKSLTASLVSKFNGNSNSAFNKFGATNAVSNNSFIKTSSSTQSSGNSYQLEFATVKLKRVSRITREEKSKLAAENSKSNELLKLVSQRRNSLVSRSDSKSRRGSVSRTDVPPVNSLNLRDKSSSKDRKSEVPDNTSPEVKTNGVSKPTTICAGKDNNVPQETLKAVKLETNYKKRQ